MTRQIDDWISGFLDYTTGLKSPEIFRRWAAISSVAGALGRRVDIRIEGQIQFANLYVILTSPPGIGKSNALKRGRALLQEVQTIHLTPTKLTERAMYGVMEDAFESSIDKAGGLFTHSSVTAMIDELALFLPRGNLEFMETLSEIYDNPMLFEYRTHHVGENRIEKPCLNLAGGIAVKHLKERFTDEALDQGFPSRVILIYSMEKIKVPLFSGVNAAATEDAKNKIYGQLIHDLNEIHQMQGRFRWQKESAQYLEAWVEEDMQPRPQDVRLDHYCTRRLAHITKLCMILSSSRDNDLVIELKDVKEARDILLAAEHQMTNAIDALAGNPYYDQSETARKFVEARCRQRKKPVPERDLRRMLLRDVPPQVVGYMVDSLVDAGIIKKHSGEKPRRLFIPADDSS